MWALVSGLGGFVALAPSLTCKSFGQRVLLWRRQDQTQNKLMESQRQSPGKRMVYIGLGTKITLICLDTPLQPSLKAPKLRLLALLLRLQQQAHPAMKFRDGLDVHTGRSQPPLLRKVELWVHLELPKPTLL